MIARFDADPMLPWTKSMTRLISFANTMPTSPGTEVAYSDSNYVLLGRILEEVTGQPIMEVIGAGSRAARTDRDGLSS